MDCVEFWKFGQRVDKKRGRSTEPKHKLYQGFADEFGISPDAVYKAHAYLAAIFPGGCEGNEDGRDDPVACC